MSIRKILLVIIIVLFVSFIFKEPFKEYEYIDYNNNKETSHKCYGDKEGMLFCVKDGKLIRVKQYKVED